MSLVGQPEQSWDGECPALPSVVLGTLRLAGHIPAANQCPTGEHCPVVSAVNTSLLVLVLLVNVNTCTLFRSSFLWGQMTVFQPNL